MTVSGGRRSPGGEEEYFSAGFTAEVAEDTEWRSPGGEAEYFSCMASQKRKSCPACGGAGRAF